MIQSTDFAQFGQGWETESPTTFGEWLSQSRKGLRLTRDELARRVGCSVSALQKIEYGERRPSAQVAELIANCLEIPLQERATFVRVARGELGMARLPLEPKSGVYCKWQTYRPYKAVEMGFMPSRGAPWSPINMIHPLVAQQATPFRKL